MSIKHVNSLLAVTVAALAGLTITTTASAATTDNGATRITTASLSQNEGTFTNWYYRANKATSIKLMFYSQNDSSKVTYKKLTVPKGTILASRAITTWQPYIFNDGFYRADLSYHLKKQVINTMGNYYGSGALYFKFKPSSRFTRIKRPGYALPYGNNMLAKGGLSAIKKLPTVTSDAIKLTSDGYIETYKLNTQDVLIRNATQFWRSKPTNYRKINHVLVKGASTYLYYSSKLPNVNDKQVRKSGPYKYRLTITNKHTPYRYEDTSQGDDTGFSSIYTIGGTQYNTRIAQGWN